uniref:Uncharacterized protein n=1 Tax=Tanacetum cinerariifolium TaxID=118510 RepID=A0A6L2J7V0_TANCI|nr:hypothetical protein [Tanacetum cinerariifolium]
MVAILEKGEHSVDFHPIVDFVEASPPRIVPLFDTMLVQQGEGSGIPTEPHHTPSPEAHSTSHTTHSSSTLPPVTTASILTITPSETTPISQGEACPIDSGFEADQDRETIAMTSTLPHDSAPRVTSPVAVEGSMQQSLNELTAFCTSLQRQHSELISKFEAHELEINMLKVRVKLLEDREGLVGERSGDDAPIKRRNLDEEEAAAERVSDNTEEMAIVLTSMDAATVLASGVAEVPTGSGSIPTVGPPAAEVPTGSDVVPTASLVFTTATVVARYLGEKMAREDQRLSKHVARDAEIKRIHAEEELQSIIYGLDRSNETVTKYQQECQQFASELPLERRIELISDFVRYQDNYAKVHKYHSQQRKPWSKKQKRDYYMAVIRSNLGWKVKDFRGMTFEEIEAKFTTESEKKLKTSDEVLEEVKSPDEVPKEKVKEMMQLVPIEEVYVESLQVKHPIIDWKHMDREDLNQLWALVKEPLSNRQPTSDKEMELWVELKRNKMHKAFLLPVIEFPLAEEVPTASEESCHCQKKREATAVKIALLSKSRRNCQSKSNDSYAKLVPHVTPCILGITVIVTSCTRTPCPIKGVL